MSAPPIIPAASITLAIIARAPEADRVKTRLAAALGPAAALAIYRQLLARVAALVSAWPGPVRLHADGDDRAWHGSGLEHLPRRSQPPVGLGGRIAAALHDGFVGAEAVIVIGSDCPAVTLEQCLSLVALLRRAHVAIGPATDGGYWAIATRDLAAITVICDDRLPWSTPSLCARTRDALAAANITTALGSIQNDCDDEHDYRSLVAAGLLTSVDGTIRMRAQDGGTCGT